MATHYAAFLRGINVGNRRVSGAELAAAFETVEGIAEAQPFLASGNLAFIDERRRKPATVERLLEAAIEAAFGWESKTFLRTATAIAELAAAEPFSERQLAASKGKPQVVLLDREPSAAEGKQIEALSSDDDRLQLQGPNLHWLPKGGFAETKLDVDALGRLGGAGTTRTKNTIVRMQAKFFAEPG